MLSTTEWDYKHIALLIAIPALEPLQQILKLSKVLCCLGSPISNYFVLFFAASRSEGTVAGGLRRALAFAMELQLALLLAGVIAFSDAARGKPRCRRAGTQGPRGTPAASEGWHLAPCSAAWRCRLVSASPPACVFWGR